MIASVHVWDSSSPLWRQALSMCRGALEFMVVISLFLWQACSLPFKPLPFRNSVNSLAVLSSTPSIFGTIDAMLHIDWLEIPKLSR